MDCERATVEYAGRIFNCNEGVQAEDCLSFAKETGGHGGKDAKDSVCRPAHYTRGRIECVDAIEAAIADLEGTDAWLTAQCIKYIWRWKWKNGLEDLRKAQWYLDRLISQEENRND